MSLDISRIKVICFDLDGTLGDTDDQYVHNLTNWLRPFGYLFPSNDLSQFARQVVMKAETPGIYLLYIANRLGIDVKLKILSDNRIFHRRNQDENTFILIPGIKDMLEKLQDSFRLSIVSARSSSTTHSFLDQFGLTSYFEQIASAGTCRFTKPAPDPILWVAQKLAIDPADCLLIGYTTLDIISGKRAGAQTVAVLCGFEEEAELRRVGADLILETTTDITEILLGDTKTKY